MYYRVTFNVTLDKTTTNQSQHRIGEVIELLPFIPFVGLHLGDWQLVTVCQVHYLGTTFDGNPSFLADCKHISDPDHFRAYGKENWKTIEEMEQTIIDGTKLKWKFRDNNK
jgi:hypothetical protein